MKKSFVLAFTLCLAGTLSAATPTCEKRLGVTWADIKQCMNELHTTYPDQFPAAVFGYVPPGTTLPIISAVGTGLGNEAQHMTLSTDDDPILWLGSVSKPFLHSAALIVAEQYGVPYDSKFADIPGARAWLVDGDFYAASRARKDALTLKQVLTMTAGFGYSDVAVTDNSPLRSATELPFFSQPSMNPAAADACMLAHAGTSDPARQYLEEAGLYDECVFLPAIGQWRGARDTLMKDVAQHLMRYPMRVDPIGPNLYPLRYANRSSYMPAG
jgi:CubicO group peptidase (beta-lactamase class C family)